MIEQIHKNAILDESLKTNLDSENTTESSISEVFSNLAQDEECNMQKLEDSPQEELLDLKTDENSIPNEDNQANCLALTVRKDYNLTIVKNIFTTSGRMSLKIALSTLVLNFLRMFF